MTKGNFSYCNLSVATKEKYNNKSTGEVMEETQWHRVVFFDKAAKVICDYCEKGDKIFVSGKMVYRKYEGKDGVERVSAQIRAQKFTLCGAKREAKPAAQDDTAGAFDDMDDIPF